MGTARNSYTVFAALAVFFLFVLFHAVDAGDVKCSGCSTNNKNISKIETVGSSDDWAVDEKQQQKLQLSTGVRSSEEDDDNSETGFEDEREVELGNSTDAADASLSTSARRVYGLSFIRVFANDIAFVYINGKRVGRASKRQGTVRITRGLKAGDVVGFFVTNRAGPGGILINVFHNGRSHYSRPGNGFKTRKYVALPGWNTKKVSSCGRDWSHPKFTSGPSKKLFLKKARYMWDKNTRRIGTMYVRYVVNGEKCPKLPPSYIRIRADDYAVVFLNGKRLTTVSKRSGVRIIRKKLRRKDVLAFKVVNKAAWGGVLIDVFHNGKHHYSGHSRGFKAHKLSLIRGKDVLPSTWKTKKSFSCKWKHSKKISGGLKRPFPSRAKYIWAKGVPKRAIVAVRYVVGGERCRPSNPSLSSLTYIRVRADDYVVVFLNGRRVATVSRRNGARFIRRRLRRNDVLAFKVVNKAAWGGVLIDVFHNGKHHYSGHSRGFKAHKLSLIRGKDVLPSTWKTKKSFSCKWKQPKKISGGLKRPFPSRAKYIWAKGLQKQAVVAVRYVVGRERCRTATPTPSSYIRIRTNALVRLYVNNLLLKTVSKSSGVQTFAVSLRKNDVVGFLAVSRVRWPGLLIDVFYARKHHYSGVSRFYKARPFVIPRRGRVSNNWKKKSFSSCFWRKPWTARKAMKTKLSSRPRHIWAKGAAAKSTVVIRHVVGGEKCSGPATPKPPKVLSFIRVRADDYVRVLVNGRPVRVVTKAQKSVKIRVPLTKGDVVAFRAVNVRGWGGVLIDVYYRRRHHYSGLSRNFKAIKFSSLGPVGKATFGRSVYPGCSWSTARRITGGKKFPFYRRSSYVWAKGAKKKAVIAIRYVVGGEKCPPRPSRTVKPTPPPRRTPSIGGYGDDDTHCPCRPIPNEKSYCYKMHNKLARVGTCDEKKCETKYECVPGAKKLPDCVKRYAEYQVVKINSSPIRCKNIKLPVKTVFWVRY